MSYLETRVPGGSGATRDSTSRLDRALGLAGLGVAVVTIGFGLVAQATGQEWLVWTAAALVGVSVVGVVRNTVRYATAYEPARAFGWFLGSWLVIAVGLVVATLVAGDSTSLFSMSGLRTMFGSEGIAVSAVVMGLATGMTSVGLLRGRPSRSRHFPRLGGGLLAVAGVGILALGIAAWLAPATIPELEQELEVVDAAEPGILQVVDSSERFEVRAYGYEGTGDPASEGWDRWVVVSVDEVTGEEADIVYGPAGEDETWSQFATLEQADRTVIFEGTEAEIDVWLEEEGSGYKDHLTPAVLVWMGVLLATSALTVAPDFDVPGVG